MSDIEKKTPARLIGSAAQKLPRNILMWVMLAYIVAGLFWRDPWKTDDIAGLANMLSVLHTPEHWLTTYIGQYAVTEEGPLNAWIGASFIYVLAPLFSYFTDTLNAQIFASRLPVLLYFFAILWGVWYGTYLLARRPETQPLRLPFGGEPNPRDYGRMLADVAFLFLIATVGILVRIHETSSFPLLLALHALAFYGFVRMLDHHIQAFFVLSVTMALAFLTRGFVALLPLLIVALGLMLCHFYTAKQKLSLALALLVASGLVLLWWFFAQQTDPVWMHDWLYWNREAFSLSQLFNSGKSLRDLSWFLWPTWPFALLALWNWRKWWSYPHLLIPSLFLLGNLAIIFTINDAFEIEYGPLTMPMAVIAAMAIPTLRRSTVNLLDWYSIMVISLSLLTAWLGWIALYFGWPAQINHNIMRLIAGFDVQIHWLAMIVALIVCVLWYMVVSWRLRTHPQALWRGIVLSAAGLTCTWLVLAMLWLPAIDYNRSYRPIASYLKQVTELVVPEADCIRSHGLGLGQRAAFYVFANLDFSYNSHCSYVFIQTSLKHIADNTNPYPDSGVVHWQGQRRAERHGETFILLKLY